MVSLPKLYHRRHSGAARLPRLALGLNRPPQCLLAVNATANDAASDSPSNEKLDAADLYSSASLDLHHGRNQEQQSVVPHASLLVWRLNWSNLSVEKIESASPVAS